MTDYQIDLIITAGILWLALQWPAFVLVRKLVRRAR